jgi:uncharacterized protein YjiS (DUF1127 family)
MRDHVLNQAIALDQTSAFATLRRYFANWRRRRKLARLAELDDRILADIGIERDEIDEAVRLSLSLNPLHELDRRARLRRTRGQRHA